MCFDVSIIIINYRTPQLVIDCVQSIIEKTKDINYDMGFGIFLHHVICDVRIDNGEKESQVYRIFSKKEYEDVINKGFYMIETYLEKF